MRPFERDLTSTRTMEALEISTTRDDHAGAAESKRIPKFDGIVDIFKYNKATSKEIIYHYNLVWSESDFRTDTLKYFRNFKTAPTNTAKLEVARNERRLKHVMVRGKL